MYVIWNVDERAYVAPPGTFHSFTRKLQYARRFQTMESAQSEGCGNERMVSVEEAMRNAS